MANGLKEFTKEHGYEKGYGKRVFAKTARSRSFIKFDYINIAICIDGFYGFWNPSINEHELKCILAYLNLSKLDRESDGYIYKLENIVRFIERKLEMIEKHIEMLGKVEKKRAIRITDTFNSIKL